MNDLDSAERRVIGAIAGLGCLSAPLNHQPSRRVMTDTTPDPFRTTPVDEDDAQANWTYIGGKADRWYHRDWTIDEAKSGAMAAAFLVADPEDVSGWMAQDMRIEDAEGNAVGYLVHPDRLEKIRGFEAEVERMKEQPVDGALHLAIHGPGAGGDALLVDTEAIRKDVAYQLAIREAKGEPRPARGDEAEWVKWRADRQVRADEIEREDSLLGLAVNLAYCLAPQPDQRGVVPVRAWHSAPQEASAEQEAHWVLAYTTPARGLFVRSGQPNLWGEDFAVVTGSGWQLRGGFLSREIASEYATAIAAAVPGIDWRTWSMPVKDAPDGLLEALMTVNKAWTNYGPREERTPVSA